MVFAASSTFALESSTDIFVCINEGGEMFSGNQGVSYATVMFFNLLQQAFSLIAPLPCNS